MRALSRVVWLIAVLAGVAVTGRGEAAPSNGAPRYDPPVNVGVVATNGGFVSQLAVADFNGDGRQDVIFTRSVYQGQQTFPVTVLLNSGHGIFVDATTKIFSGPVPQRSISTPGTSTAATSFHRASCSTTAAGTSALAAASSLHH